MREALKLFFQKPTTKAGIASVLMFQLIFCIVWMTAYHDVSENTGKLRITVVNEDQGFGKQIAQQLETNLPFTMLTEPELDTAMAQLNGRSTQMVLHIPSGFSGELQAGGAAAQMQYYINESNPALIKSIMQGVSSQVTALVNKQAVGASAQTILVQANVPAAEAKMTAHALSERVASQIQRMNPVSGTANQMVPMMMVLASFVGAMVMNMNLEQSSMMIGARIGRWSKFGARLIINAVSAIVVALVGTSLTLALGGQAEAGFLALWGFQTLFLFTFMVTSQFFLTLFGMAGMLCNIVLLSAQLVSSGAMVPRELLSGFYRGISEVFPATYAVEGLMNLLFGGSSAGKDVLVLVAFVAALVLLNMVTITLKRPATLPQPGGAKTAV
ncbi:YhgE/Pip domain-containing protein [Paenibacillus sp. y28]|uniref:YhgE/Pip domain-containing protein n=1 Tax=Paenibacillus sp. y28 TaxID=3129110 RepID=UPI0030199880